MFSTRGGFILSSGCEIPPGSKPENVAALVCAAR
ncbi:MAG: uroporphyrinogen decarboxylase family protein [Syntrophobacteraceae bacterium]